MDNFYTNFAGVDGVLHFFRWLLHILRSNLTEISLESTEISLALTLSSLEVACNPHGTWLCGRLKRFKKIKKKKRFKKQSIPYGIFKNKTPPAPVLKGFTGL